LKETLKNRTLIGEFVNNTESEHFYQEIKNKTMNEKIIFFSSVNYFSDAFCETPSKFYDLFFNMLTFIADF